MQIERRIIVTLTSRLFADEITKLQDKIGCIVTIQDPHKLQNLHSVGLAPVCNRDVLPDFIKMYSYLSRATLAILDEVTPDSLIFTRLDASETYQIKNVYRPMFQWDSHAVLSVIPPVFGIEDCTVSLESNGFDLIFPLVVPYKLGLTIIQKLMIYNIYSRIHDDEPEAVNMDEVRLLTTTFTHMGRTYTLNFDHNDPRGVLQNLDNLVIYSSMFTLLLPKALGRIIPSILRHDQHELLGVFTGLIPDELIQPEDVVNLQDDITRMESFIAYMQALSSIFNLSPRIRLSAYSPETLTGTCWLLT